MIAQGGSKRAAATRAGWPYEKPREQGLARTLPGGREWPKISVVTPTLNQGRYIEETILSVLQQGYPNVEHIIIDGGSSDETGEVLERYQEQLGYVVSEPDGGQSAAINKGMARASGEILTWLNSDDMLAPGALAGMALAFATSGADMVAGVCRIYEEGKVVEQHLTSCGEGALPLEDLLDLEGCWDQGQFFYQPEVMFRREIWERAGGYVDESLYYSMDYELWVRFAEAGARLHVIGRPVAWFRRHAGQKTHETGKFRAELGEWREKHRAKRAAGGGGGSAGGSKPWRQRLRILLLNDHGFRYGAGIAHERLAQAIGWAGQEVGVVTLEDQPLAPSGTPGYTNREVVEAVEKYNPDLVLVGNLHSAKADAWLLSLIGERYPVLCVLHDLWLLTGRCGYPSGCTKYLEGCDASCPTPHEYPQLEPEKIGGAWARKRQMLEQDPPYLLTYSSWAAEFAVRTVAHLRERTRTVRPSIPLDVFERRDKGQCRRKLDLPEDRFIVLATSEFRDGRKGLDHLLEALEQLQLPDVLLVSTSWAEPDGAQLGSIPLRRLGYVEDRQRLAMIYAAADVLVGPSLEETFGQIFVEAAACGTPVIGYPLTAVGEAVKDGVTGRLAGGVGPRHLAAAIQELYEDRALREDMASWGPLYVENEWSPFAAWHDLFVAFRSFGLLEKLHCPPKISFLEQAPPVPAVHSLLSNDRSVLRGTGLGYPEGPSAEHNLPRFRWAMGPQTELEVQSSYDGPNTLALVYRNLLHDQTVSVSVNGSRAGDYPLVFSGLKESRLLICDVSVRRGLNTIELSFSKWFKPEDNNRPLALLLITAALISPVDRSPAG